jgi:hypothetical protein
MMHSSRVGRRAELSAAIQVPSFAWRRVCPADFALGTKDLGDARKRGRRVTAGHLERRRRTARVTARTSRLPTVMARAGAAPRLTEA